MKFDYDAKLLAREAYLFREQISGSKNQYASSVFHLRMRQLGVIRDKQSFSAADVARE